jgi:hypothetical protein
MEGVMQSITTLGFTELTNDDLAGVVGGEGDCWCKSFARGLGYAIGYAVGTVVDALVRPSDDNSFLQK